MTPELHPTTGLTVSVQRLSKRYGKNVDALRGVDLTVQAGEFMTVLGPSGSGKTTLLMTIAGFELPTYGQILVGGADVTGLRPEQRNFGVVFQNYALFPHMTVGGNIGYPLAVRNVPRTTRLSLLADALAMVGLEGYEARMPHELSGGQQQRVALARALVYRPPVLLLDEPLGALDRSLRQMMQVELRSIHQQVGVTFIHVTHDQEEAMALSDRIVIMKDGKIVQVGRPEELYRFPASAFVAGFLGATNLLTGTVVSTSNEAVRIRLNSGLQVDSRWKAPEGPLVGPVALSVRPEKLGLFAPGEQLREGLLSFSGRILREVFMGTVWQYRIGTSAGELEVTTTTRAVESGSGEVVVAFEAADTWTVPTFDVYAGVAIDAAPSPNPPIVNESALSN